MSSEDDSFVSVAAEHGATLKVQRSEFISLVFPMTEASQLEKRREQVSRKHFDASHHCWAYRLRDGRIEHSSDAGEPSGSAGRPILSAIQGAGLWNCGLVVTRYFGGIKLGTGGLARAYRDAAQQVLREAPLVTHYEYTRVTIRFTYAQTSTAYRLLSPPDIVLAGENLESGNQFLLDVRRSRVEALRRILEEKRIDYALD